MVMILALTKLLQVEADALSSQLKATVSGYESSKGLREKGTSGCQNR